MDNLASVLRFAAYLIGQAERPAAPRPMPSAGFWRGEPVNDARPSGTDPVLPRAGRLGDTEPIEALRAALDAAWAQCRVPVYLTSLKDERSIGLPARRAVGVSAGSHHQCHGVRNGARRRRCRRAGRIRLPDPAGAQSPACRASRGKASTRGLLPRDLAMHVVLPEVDGRIFAHAIAFKEQAAPPVAGFAPTVLRALPDRVDAPPISPPPGCELRQKPREQRRRRDHPCELSEPRRTTRQRRRSRYAAKPDRLVLDELCRQGYAIENVPASSAEMMQLLQRGPDQRSRGPRDAGRRRSLAACRLSRAGLRSLPSSIRDADRSAMGHARRTIRTSRRTLSPRPASIRQCHCRCAAGARLQHRSEEHGYHDPDLVPPHNYLAFYLWLRACLRLPTPIVHLGKHGNLEWLPGKSIGLSANCLPERCWAPLPHLYPFIVNDPGEGIQAKRRASAVIVDHLTPPTDPRRTAR